MKRTNRILLGFGFLALLLISWIIAAGAKSNTEKQWDLIEQAEALIDDGIYIRAEPLLEEASGYKTEYTQVAESMLKKVYLALIDKSGYRRKYTDLLEKQMSSKTCGPDVFAETADYYLGISKIPDALAVLKAGIEKTGSQELAALFEANRYTYDTGRDTYEYASAISGATAQVRSGGLWGIARAGGSILIPCEYEKISTFSNDRVIVAKDGEVFAVDINNNRIAKLHENTTDFGNYADNRIPLCLDDGWRRSTGDFEIGKNVYEQIGMYSEGFAAAKQNGKWGVVDLGTDWLIPAEYDEIIQDELGRCYARGAVFARSGDMVYLFYKGRQAVGTYDDARPFTDEGFAAVKRNGKWGFIDIDGAEVFDFIYDDALSFGQHLAAVKQDGLWGYIGCSGKMVIDPGFLAAKSFSNGSAPVLTERGWCFITLLEYKS